ncbi:MAG: AURKAIP1/COX24 domain-containing protein [candidate division Zixibacteria bacterium]|nr:AURKAIP1/COX24 domain-containing protein [candidate division Zixibacteria bacterium]
MGNVTKKRRRKMSRHKHRKRLKRTRHKKKR